jgi:hypothetical protein
VAGAGMGLVLRFFARPYPLGRGLIKV